MIPGAANNGRILFPLPALGSSSMAMLRWVDSFILSTSLPSGVTIATKSAVEDSNWEIIKAHAVTLPNNDPVARFFHRQLTADVAAIAGEPVKPSYVYLASYQPRAILKKHTDREQCEFSVTLCLDYSPEPHCATPWPLHLHKKSGTVTVFQGDRGCLALPRPPVPALARCSAPRAHVHFDLLSLYPRRLCG